MCLISVYLIKDAYCEALNTLNSEKETAQRGRERAEKEQMLNVLCRLTKLEARKESAFEKWERKNDGKIPAWIKNIGEPDLLEVLATLCLDISDSSERRAIRKIILTQVDYGVISDHLKGVINSAYKKASLKYHPDKQAVSATQGQKERASELFQVLSNITARARNVN